MKWRVSTYALMLAAAGLPLYIHLPRYATGELGMSLATLGVILAGIRVMDFAPHWAGWWIATRVTNLPLRPVPRWEWHWDL